MNQQFVATIDMPDMPGIVHGTWTPVIGGDSESGQAYQYQAGHYVKIGPLVHVWAYTQFANVGTILGPLVLKGLPFPTVLAPGFFAGQCAYFSNLGPTAPLSSLLMYAGGGQVVARLFGIEQGKYMNPRPLVAADLNLHTQFVLALSYPTDV